MITLRSLNCICGFNLISNSQDRVYIKKLHTKFPNLFKEKMNDAQCMYLNHLMRSNLSVDETGRLFQARKTELNRIWVPELYRFFIIKELRKEQMGKDVKALGLIDPIYSDSYIKGRLNQREMEALKYYLL